MYSYCVGAEGATNIQTPVITHKPVSNKQKWQKNTILLKTTLSQPNRTPSRPRYTRLYLSHHISIPNAKQLSRFVTRSRSGSSSKVFNEPLDILHQYPPSKYHVIL